MNLVDYSDSDTDKPLVKKTKIQAAPDTTLVSAELAAYLPSAGTKEITHNLPFDDLAKPLVGPMNPYALEAVNKNTLNGKFTGCFIVSEVYITNN